MTHTRAASVAATEDDEMSTESSHALELLRRESRRMIVYIATSADGYIARPDGDIEWLNRRHPLALNFSKSGIGISAGVRRLRAGITSHHRMYTSAGLPGTGLRFVRYYRHHHASEPPAHAVRSLLFVEACSRRKESQRKERKRNGNPSDSPISRRVTMAHSCNRHGTSVGSASSKADLGGGCLNFKAFPVLLRRNRDAFSISWHSL